MPAGTYDGTLLTAVTITLAIIPDVLVEGDEDTSPSGFERTAVDARTRRQHPTII